MTFIHLRLHTEYSVQDSTLRIDDAVALAARDAQPALAITDLSNLFGAVKFYNACFKRGVQPILGADVWLAPEAGAPLPSRLLLLVQNRQGYLNLCELLSHAWVEQAASHGEPWIDAERLRAHSDGLIALSGAEHGAVGQALLMGDAARAREVATRLSGVFPGRFYLELQRAGLPKHEALVKASVTLAHELQLPVVATHPVQFASPDDFEAHEARVCVAEGDTLGNPRRVKRFGPEQFMKTQSAMKALFSDLPSAVANTAHIAKRCSLMLELGRPQLPNFPTPLLPSGEPTPVDDHFRQLSHAGLEARLLTLYPKVDERDAARPRYLQRLEFELQTIVKMKFPGYFLIVADFINWAKTHGCPVGPGRGSGAGSLVAYALGITDLDPLAYNLLFERFLNPDRVSMPDFDIDFCQANRDRVIDYVKDKYGREAVSQIVTFGTMAAKAALRDVGRVLGMGYGHVDGIAKLVPAPPGKTVTLKRPPSDPAEVESGLIYARSEAPEIEERERREEEVAELLRLAERLEGVVRNVGMHAGGVLIAPGKITDFCPLYQQPGSQSAVSQYDKDDVEAIGLVKFDFLGLATLTIMELCKTFIRAQHPKHADFEFERLPLNDRATYQLMSQGQTVAVFQLESTGMQRMLRDAKPSRFEDIIALVALYRPGPMDLIPSFCARKHGREEVQYPHPLMREVLQETYGIMVYQEQVMQVAQRLGGYTLGGADLLRRAMGKKKMEEMAQHRAIFAKGAAEQGIQEPLANEIFDLMEKFAGYGFNKSHAAAYALLAYHTAYLKAHFLAEFTAANMTVAMDDTDKLKIYFDDAKALGVTLLPPDINTSTYRFWPLDAKRVRYGLGAIKGTGQGAALAIEAAREDGPFTSLFNFAARVDRTRVNKRAFEALIKCGAFDALHPNRASLAASLPLALDWADAQIANANQVGLFDLDDSHGAAGQEPELIDTPPFGVRERLMLEKQGLGFYLSGHLFDEVREEVRRFVKRPISEVQDTREPQLLAGIVSEVRLINGQRGRVAIFKLDDQSEAIEAVVNDELLSAHRDLLQEDAVLIASGRVQVDRFSSSLRFTIQALWDLPRARCQFGQALHLVLNPGECPPLAQWLQAHPPQAVPASQAESGEGEPSSVRVQGLRLRARVMSELASAELDLGPQARIFPSDEALAMMRGQLKSGRATVLYDT